ncbi:MAG TPA: molybdate ABC transporter substrate-binding protein, partial [Tepidisphaeraceae bacterium]|nr:molybdate ABC transporter substrate-binding protein [Tepidisphaeraceae bacterium]
MKLLTSLALLLTLTHQTFGEDKTLDIAAAASLKESITEIAPRFESSEGVKLNLTFNASGTLAKQIEQGAPADIFISAAEEQIEELERAELVFDGSRTIIAGNELVLIAPPDSSIKSFDDLKSDMIKHIAIGQPDSVPAGQYAVQTFKSLGIFELIESKFLYGTNVRQVLEYIVRGDVDAGIVYSSDAKAAGDSVKLCATAPSNLHDP